MLGASFNTNFQKQKMECFTSLAEPFNMCESNAFSSQSQQEQLIGVNCGRSALISVFWLTYQTVEGSKATLVFNYKQHRLWT